MTDLNGYHFTYFLPPKIIYLQSPQNILKNECLLESLKKLDKKTLVCPAKYSYNEIYGVFNKYKAYRVKIVKLDKQSSNSIIDPADGKVSCLAIDEGCYASCSMKFIKCLPPGLTVMAPLAERFSLHNVDIPHIGKDMKRIMIERVKERLSNRLITIRKVTSRNDVPSIEVYNGMYNLNEDIRKVYAYEQLQYDPGSRNGQNPQNLSMGPRCPVPFSRPPNPPSLWMDQRVRELEADYGEDGGEYDPYNEWCKSAQSELELGLENRGPMQRLRRNNREEDLVDGIASMFLKPENPRERFRTTSPMFGTIPPPIENKNGSASRRVRVCSAYVDGPEQSRDAMGLLRPAPIPHGNYYHSDFESDFNGHEPYGPHGPYSNGISVENKIADLQAQLRECTQENKKLKEENMLTKSVIEQSCHNIRQVISHRTELSDQANNETKLINAMEYLSDDDLFNHNVIQINQRGEDIQRIKSNGKQVPYAKICKIQEYFYSISPDVKQDQIVSMLSILKCTVPEVEQDKFNDCNTNMSAMKAIVDYKAWRSSYDKLKANTDDAIIRMYVYLKSTAKKIMHSALPDALVTLDMNGVSPNDNQAVCDLWGKLVTVDDSMSEFNQRDIIKCAQAEEDILKKWHGSQGIFKLTLICVYQELQERIKRLTPIKKYQAMVDKLNIERQMEDKENEDFPSLLKFVTTSYQSRMTYSTNKLIVKDLVTEVSALHQKRIAYLHINPENILINEGAKLRPTNEAILYEPVPPYTFMAPEMVYNEQSSPSDNLLLHKKINQDRIMGDIYSVGQIMLWLSLISGKSVQNVTRNCEIIKRMISLVPSERPTIEEIKENIVVLGHILFGDTPDVSQLPKVRSVPIGYVTAKEDKMEESAKPQLKVVPKKVSPTPDINVTDPFTKLSKGIDHSFIITPKPIKVVAKINENSERKIISMDTTVIGDVFSNSDVLKESKMNSKAVDQMTDRTSTSLMLLHEQNLLDEVMDSDFEDSDQD